MDEDLLDRYFAGQCTAGEAARVKRWLEQPVQNEDRLLGRSWRHIQQHMRNRPVLPLLGYSLTAAALFLVVLNIGWKLFPQDFEIRNTSLHYNAFDASGLQLRLPPQASARVNLGIVSQRADLVFCGDVRIHNTSENDVQMKLNLKCANGNVHHNAAVLNARKGKKYVAFPYHYKSDEVVVVEEDRLFDLPLPLQQKALKALEI